MHSSLQKTLLTEGSVPRHLIRMSLPMAWGIFALITFNIVDTYFVAQLGTDELSAISFTIPVVNFFLYIGLALGIATSSVTSRFAGSFNIAQIKIVTSNALGFSLLTGGLVCLIGLGSIDFIFFALHTPKELLSLVHQYMDIWYYSVIFMFISIVGNSAIRGTGDTLLPSIVMTMAACINIALDPVLIFGFYGFPKMGLKGAALATCIGYGAAVFVCLYILYFKKQMIDLATLTWANFLKSSGRILYVGIPAALTNVITPLSQAATVWVLAIYGKVAVAGFGIAIRVENFALIPIFALTACVVPFMGQNSSANNKQRMREGMWVSTGFFVLWGAITTLILGTFSDNFAMLFNQDPEVVQSASLYLALVPISYFFYSLTALAASLFNGIGNPVTASVILLCRAVIFYIPLLVFFNHLFGIKGIYIAISLANVGSGIMAYYWSHVPCKSRSY